MTNIDKQAKIRVGIVGVGNWGRYGHIPVLHLLPNFEIAAVASRRKEYAQETAKQFGIAHTFTDANELINHPDVDLVVVLLARATAASDVSGSRLSDLSATKFIMSDWDVGIGAFEPV